MAAMKKYAAKLLFQFRVVSNGMSNRRRLCEERIILINARNAKAALTAAKKRGSQGEHDYENSAGGRVFFEFVGVMDLLELGIECSQGEVWYDIVERLEPKERRGQLVPKEARLSSIRLEKRIQDERRAARRQRGRKSSLTRTGASEAGSR
jgi:hypothetical protein